MKLFLDDRRKPYDVFRLNMDLDYYENNEWKIVKSYSEFVNFINKYGLPDIVSFDHDLSYEHYLPENQKNINYNNLKQKTGYHTLEWMLKYCKKKNKSLPIIKFHTQNIEGEKNMKKLLF
jgi:hypothetical protein